ncbi:MAG TPA: CocE/NonD family hydrolase [Iamia sp.]
MKARRRLVALVGAVVTVLTLVPAAPGSAPAGAAVSFTVRGSIEQVATWGHTPGTVVSLSGGPGTGWGIGYEADAQGAVLFRNVPPGSGYVVSTSAGAADPVTVTDPEDHPAASSYEAIDLPAAGGYTYIPTRDGTLLSANIVMPFAGTTTGPRPVVVTYSGYDPSNPEALPPEALPYAARGYVVVAVNMRGSGCSGGAFDYYEPATSTDGYDVIETVATQSWSNGRVGMVGISYSGISQLYVAATQPPHLRAITPLSPYSDAYRGILYPGGIRNEGFALQWALDRQEAARPSARPWVRDRIAAGDTTCAANQVLRLQSRDLEAEISPNRFDSDEYDYLSISSFADRIEVPVYLAAQFQDEQTGGSAVHLAQILQNSGHVFRGTFGNGAHADPMGPTELPRVLEFVDFYVGRQVPDMSFLRPLLPDILDDLFDQPIEVPPDRFTGMSFFAAKAAYEQEKPIRIRYEVGGIAGKEGAPYATAERTYAAWPLPGTTAQRWYLQPDGALASTPPAAVADGTARATSSYRYAPDEIRPPTFDGPTDAMWKRHPDVEWDSPAEDTALTFTTPAATGTSVYAGTGSVDLWLGSTAADTDLEAVITEVRPDGQEVYVQSGWLRASHRALDLVKSTALRPWPTHREADAAPIPADALTLVRLELFPFAHVVRPGGRLRLSIEAPGGNQPLWDYTELPGEATNTVGHSVGRPSSVALPLVSDPGAVAALPTTAPSCSVPGVTVQSQSLRNQPCRADRSPRRPGAIVARAFGPGDGDGGIHVSWTAPVRWPGTPGPTGYEIALPELGRTTTAGADATSVFVNDVPRGTAVTAIVTPVYADGGGIASNASLPVTIPAVTDGEAFVQAAWQDFLDQEPSANHFGEFGIGIDIGTTTRRAVVTELAASEEWVAAIVDGLYEDTLGRPGDPDGRAFWIDAIRTGHTTVAKAAAGFYASSEYVNGIGGGTLPSWVSDLYVKVLGRTATDQDRAYWVGQVPTRGRGWVALQIFQSAESAADRVEALYQALLGRAAEPSAVAFWGPRVVARGDIALAVDLASSAEYLARAHARFG